MESPDALNDDFNLSTEQSTAVAELAAVLWRKINGDRPLSFVHDQPFDHDVAMRVPDVSKAKRVLGFEATTTLDEMLEEILPWIEAEVAAGRL